jgi:hypothetical protein
MDNYAGDYNGWGACDLSAVGNFLFGPANANFYDKTLCGYINVPVAEDMSKGGPSPLAVCPSGRRDGTGDRTAGTGNPNFSYSFNTYLCSGDGSSFSNHSDRTSKITSVKNASKRLYCADANCHAVAIYSNTYFPGRHISGADNMIFVDGHTESWSFQRKASLLSGSNSGGADGFWHDASW